MKLKSDHTMHDVSVKRNEKSREEKRRRNIGNRKYCDVKNKKQANDYLESD